MGGEELLPIYVLCHVSRSIAADALKPEKVAQCAVARTLLHIAWAVIKKA